MTLVARLFLVRHGSTAWNAEGRAQGQSDTPLDDVGRSQAERLGVRLMPTPFVAAYSSDLKRVVDTAEPILRGRSLALQTIPELREKHYGEWEGMSYQEVEARYPELFKRLFEDDITFAPPGGESDEELFNRVRPVADRLRVAHQDDENVLVVGHGGSLRVLLVSLTGIPVDYMWRFRLANASISVVSVFSEREGAVLDLWNDTSHLEMSLGS